MRDAWLAGLRQALPTGAPWRKLPSGVTDDRLLGGLDLSATLAAGRPVAERGVLAQADGGVLILAMAERLSAGIAARLAATLDTNIVVAERDGLTLRQSTHFGVVALDEGEPDERPPETLLDRLAIWLDLTAIAPGDTAGWATDAARVASARHRLAGIAADDAVIEALVSAAAALGIVSLRPAILAVRVARASAALAGRSEIGEEDATLAARLVLAPRAHAMPPQESEPPPPPPPEPEPPEPPPDTENQSQEAPDKLDDQDLAELVLAAAAAAIPPGLLALLKQGGAARAQPGGRAEASRQSATHGRPIGVRRGDPRGGARLHLLETLRAAAPWQKIRRTGRPEAGPLIAIRRDDFRLRQFQQRTRTTTIFVVDASGSAALNRLAEAKGAVELLLAECYVRRDRVALFSVRGPGAELLLPPTSSLARAKRSLAGLPGGGGTPLAAGIEAAGNLADLVRRGGQTPLIVFLTDGRANIARDGKPGRPHAEADALAAAAALRAARFGCLLLDTAPLPHPFARKLGEAMQATYLALPYADSRRLSQAIAASRPS